MKLGHLFAVLASILWGASYAIEERVIETTTALTLVVVHAMLTVLTVGPVWVWLRRSEDTPHVVPTDPAWVRWCLAGFAVSLLANLCIYASIKHAGAEIAASLEISYPLFTILCVFLLFGRKPHPQVLLGAALIFAGSLLVMKSPT